MEGAMLSMQALSCLILSVLVAQTDAHGRLIEPPSRSSMWRYGFTTPINYDDNQLFCGGYDVQWNQNGGRCGVCGDPYNGARDNEAGGKYATGTLARHYSEGQTITITIDVTTNHGGFFEFKMCPNNNPARRVTESCLNQYLLTQPNGQTKWHLPTGTRKFSLSLVLPRGLTCTQCVMQWKWTTASNWDCDANNNCCKGCGPQETFMGCSDVAISPSGQHGFQSSGSVAGTGNTYSGANINVGAIGGHSSGVFVPVNGIFGVNTGTSAKCEATAAWKTKYAYADQWCITQCPTGNCPLQYCNDRCRQVYG